MTRAAAPRDVPALAGATEPKFGWLAVPAIQEGPAPATVRRDRKIKAAAIGCRPGLVIVVTARAFSRLISHAMVFFRPYQLPMYLIRTVTDDSDHGKARKAKKSLRNGHFSERRRTAKKHL
jgi:hypothetical protein